jgi:large subunit ribosomal protein L9
MATAANLAEFEARRVELEKAAAETMNEAHLRQKAIDELGTLEITAKVGSEGKLFGSIGLADIVEAVTAAGAVVEKREIRMPDGAIHAAGEHQIDIHLLTDVDCTVTISIVAEE